MRLAFSNIAWTPHDSPAVLDLLAREQISGVEVAPTKVWPGWQGATVAAARAYGAFLRARGLMVPALQAVLFERPEAQLFAQPAAFAAHLRYVAELAHALGATVVVLGAPRQRDRGDRPMAQAMDEAAALLRSLGPAFANAGACLCIEPNPVAYGCNFVTDARQGAALVQAVDHPGIGLHLDAAGMFLAGDDLATLWPELGTQVRHFHLSEPQLGDFTAPQVPHARNIATLRNGGYAGWLSVEMREPARPLAEVGPWAVLRAGRR